MIISSVNKLIAEEYHNIGLWFIVSFIFGIALYFACDTTLIPNR